ncbi:MAG TPA: hypothetical protein EYN73_05890 [Chromatiaceae bacterium]|nr:hypothetical protein [Chromatiaceae bacterium]HIN83223.1 hypothetical protein [Chromatiales bacterium]HIO53663.1 hypothetical protein [Chromatiales bacterium]
MGGDCTLVTEDNGASVRPDDSDDCPCQSGALFSDCCGRFIRSNTGPDTAEQLMRSRYTAFVLEDETYLQATWDPSTCPEQIEFDPRTRWLGLKIKSSSNGKPSCEFAEVEFVARYKIDGRAHRIHENSRFVKRHGRWGYLGPITSDTN